MIRRNIERAWGYYQLYGTRRFFWAVGFKINQRLNGKSSSAKGALTSQDMPPISGYEYDEEFKKNAGQLPFSQFIAHKEIARKPTRMAHAVLRKPLVAIVGDLNLPQCKKYRVMQKLEGIFGLNISADYSHYEDIYRALTIIQMSTFVIFYRARENQAFKVLMRECRRLGIPVAYDIDDPIFSDEIYGENVNLAHLDLIERKNLLSSTREYLWAMRRCDFVITSTPRLAEEIENLGIQNVILWRNAIDAETLQAVSLADANIQKDGGSARRRKSDLVIVYASGSRAHEADFRVIENVLLAALNKHAELKLNIIGYLELPETFEPYSDRITISPFSDYPGYMAELALGAISVIPLVADRFNDCKSAIRYMEASLVGLPSVVTKVGDFSNLVENGKSGFLCSSEKEWTDALEALITSADLRSKIAHEAQRSTLENLTVNAIVKSLPDSLISKITGKALP